MIFRCRRAQIGAKNFCVVNKGVTGQESDCFFAQLWCNSREPATAAGPMTAWPGRAVAGAWRAAVPACSRRQAAALVNVAPPLPRLPRLSQKSSPPEAPLTLQTQALPPSLPASHKQLVGVRWGHGRGRVKVRVAGEHRLGARSPSCSAGRWRSARSVACFRTRDGPLQKRFKFKSDSKMRHGERTKMRRRDYSRGIAGPESPTRPRKCKTSRERDCSGGKP